MLHMSFVLIHSALFVSMLTAIADLLRGSLIDTCKPFLGPKLLDNAAVKTLGGIAGKVATGLDDDCLTASRPVEMFHGFDLRRQGGGSWNDHM